MLLATYAIKIPPLNPLRYPSRKADLATTVLRCLITKTIFDCQLLLLFSEFRERHIDQFGWLCISQIASVLQLDAFTLTREDGAPLNVRAEIGFEEQAVRVVPAHDTDNWQPYRWRVDIYGRVEEFFKI